MNGKGILSLVKKHGTGKVVEATLLPKANDSLGALRKQARFLGKLTELLEKNRSLRRGMVIGALCHTIGVEEQEDSGSGS
jgi:hypothetical protein